MKKFIILYYLTIFWLVPTLGQYQPTTVQTPTGVSVDALIFTGTDFDADDIDTWNWYWTYGYNCRILENSTQRYNCHGYAWYDIEGRMGQSDLRWINDVDDYGSPIYNVPKYYTGVNKSYTETQTVTNHLRVSYYPRDHSAVTTQDQDSVISKWAWGPLVKHTLAQCPFYDDAVIKYYRLYPVITGSTEIMCSGQRTFSSNLAIPSSTYSWSKSAGLNYVSGAGTTSYTISAGGSGDQWVGFQMTTPSGEVAAASTRNFWVGMAQVQSISGPSSASRYVTYTYYANVNHSAGTTYIWSINPTGPYLTPSGGEINSCGVYFYSNGFYTLLARAVNACGTSTPAQKSINVGSKMLSGKSLILFPNPALDNVTLTIKEDPLLVTNDADTINSEKSDFKDLEPINYTVRIFDNKSNLLSTFLRSGNTFNVPLTNMRDGTYIIEVSDGNTRYTQQLLVKH